MLARFLRWIDVDPSRRARVDEARVLTIVRPVIAAAATARGPGFRDRLVETLDRELLRALGPWVAGWTWSASEPGGGGPVRGWCCAAHSLFPQVEDPAGGPRTDLADRDDDPVSASAARVAAAVADWQRCLDELAALFAELGREQELPAPAGTRSAIERAVEVAAARVLAWVIERTRAEDAWYATFTRVLAWYVEAAGHDHPRATAAIAEAVSGRFHSWVEPAPEEATAACGEVGRTIARLAHVTTPSDATAVWQARRPQAFNGLVPTARVPVREDGHVRYIEQCERARDPERAERMRAALELCRDSARRGMALTLDQLCEWQAIVLGEKQVAFRRADAFAKRGRERYPFTPATQAQFEAALRDTDGPGDPAILAARVYLDIGFHHPFADGNARAARLALDHVLTRHGLALHVADPVFVVARSSEDPRVGFCLAHVLDRLIGPIG